ncbi:hypothetical protein [Streptomyces pseudovenezuelae]|uniref:Uncharacterized protein n=1 Tax=Streptomyces pseudovenezuelae TaxID=67350 RepID=A0ABT6LUG1_9ACTN|nr:hypothetical protein [Streptomyces pseudovenezuelae]MDH6219947.1 hypothetical protein [Streptomyces pseudovenezuelae]
MPTEASRNAPGSAPAPGALLLCRAEPESVAPVALLLRERMLLTGAGEDWSVLVPEGTPWLDGGEPVDRVLTGWATALAVGAPWPVLALWWDADRAGYTLASGFRRPVGYVWLANGTPAGEDEAMRTFAARLGLDPVLDVQSLDELTKPDPSADARTRLRGFLAVLTRAGVTLPAGLTPGDPADRLHETARIHPDTRPVEWQGRRAAVRTELDAVDTTPLAPWLPHSGTPRSRALALAQVAVGLPLTAWGVRRRSGGWIAAGALLLAHGALGLAYDVVRPRD